MLAAHPDVAECAVVGVGDALKGEVPLCLVVLKAGADRTGEQLAPELVELVRQRIGPVASFKTAVVVKRLPKTRSGKIVRGTIKKIADGVAYSIPPTIDWPCSASHGDSRNIGHWSARWIQCTSLLPMASTCRELKFACCGSFPAIDPMIE